MTWNLHTEPSPAAELADAVREQTPMGQPVGECADQVEAAAVAAQTIAESGALGEGRYKVNIYGHANPDHQEMRGAHPDRITLTVLRVPDDRTAGGKDASV
jgi:hypothetical protein